MPRPRFAAIGLATAVGAALAPWWPAALPRAQTAPVVVSEHWPALGLDPLEIVLENGFRIVVIEDHRMPRIAASLQYRFGALQERNGEHGSAHFLEHAIHQGTTTVGVKDREVDRKLLRAIFDVEQELLAERNAHRNDVRERNVFFNEGDWPATETEERLRRRLYELEDEQAKNRIFWEEYNWYRRNGGIMRHTDPVPANTGNELLRIEVDLPRERLELFFRLEADRMINAVLRGWEAQRFTVLEQFFVLQRNETGRFHEAVSGVTGLAHPIFIHPGGHQRDHAFWNRASMLRMYDDYIVPNNAILTLVGDTTAGEVRTLAAAYFGRLPRSPAPPAQMDVEAEPPPGGSVRLDWLEPVEPSVLVRFRIPGVGHPDRPVFDVIARLMRGPDGLLAAAGHGRPRDAEWQATASSAGSPNTLTLEGRGAADDDLAALESTALDAVERLRREAVDAARLARARRELGFEWELLRSERGALATQVGSFAIADDWRTLRTHNEARAAAGADDIRRAAERYLVPWNRVIATTRRNPQPRAKGNTASAGPAAAQDPGGRP
jgi:predicted Zn-dependent peptidase